VADSNINKQLKERKSEILDSWLDRILDSYPADTAALWKKQKNRFANPVGQTFVDATKIILDELVNSMDAQVLCKQLERIIKIRSIQDFTPSQVVQTVFLLKPVLRQEFKKAYQDVELVADLREIEDRIDQVALFAFDVFTNCRDKLCQIRVDEVKRQVHTLMRRSKYFVDDPDSGDLKQ
jgi:hypothetical protein